MKIAVVGLWHLGTVTAASLASKGHEITAIDENEEVIRKLRSGLLPVEEPGLEELVKAGLSSGKLRFSSNYQDVRDHDLIWFTFDTPVNEADVADTEYVLDRIERCFPHLGNCNLIMTSSQLPAGSTRELEQRLCKHDSQNPPKKKVDFAYSPENLRLGKALQVFLEPDRIVVGIRSNEARKKIESLLSPITTRIEWMGVESAEMTKHAINAFLSTSVVFINEIARVCEITGADAAEVSRGLKTDERIGPKAYLKAGAAFAGGTLARDVSFLIEHCKKNRLNPEFFQSVHGSNDHHKSWPIETLTRIFANLKGKTIAVLGLTYKPGTNTLRRSSSVETCKKLASLGARIHAFDPSIRELPPELEKSIRLMATPDEILKNADALLVLTEWPEFRSLQAGQILKNMKTPILLDPNGFLENLFQNEKNIQYIKVGKNHEAH